MTLTSSKGPVQRRVFMATTGMRQAFGVFYVMGAYLTSILTLGGRLILRKGKKQIDAATSKRPSVLDGLDDFFNRHFSLHEPTRQFYRLKGTGAVHRTAQAKNFNRFLRLKDGLPGKLGVDADIRLGKGGDLIISHGPFNRKTPIIGRLFGKAPPLRDFLADILSFPAKEVPFIKLDIKDPKAVKPLIDILSEPGLANQLKTRELILNADINLFHGGSSLTLGHLKQLRNAFPKATISIGYPYGRRVTDKTAKILDEKVFPELGGSVTVAFPAWTRLPKSLIRSMKKHGAFITVWRKVKFGDPLWGIPKEGRDIVWTEQI